MFTINFRYAWNIMKFILLFLLSHFLSLHRIMKLLHIDIKTYPTLGFYNTNFFRIFIKNLLLNHILRSFLDILYDIVYSMFLKFAYWNLWICFWLLALRNFHIFFNPLLFEVMIVFWYLILLQLLVRILFIFVFIIFILIKIVVSQLKGLLLSVWRTQLWR